MSRTEIQPILALLAFALTDAALGASDRPNVLLILVDDLKPSFGAYGDEWVHSPNLDRLAAGGVRFDRAYCNQAVCAPSRANLLVGSRSTSLGVYDLATHFRVAEPDAVTLPQYFKQHGYHTAGIGKVFHVGHGNFGDDASWSEPFHPDKVIDYALSQSTGGRLTREEAYFSNQELDRIHELPRGAAWERADVHDEAYADGRIAAEGIARLKRYKSGGQPFLLALGFTKPHLPFCAPEPYWGLYDSVDLPEAKTTRLPKGAPSYAGKTPHGELNQYRPIPDRPPLDPRHARTLVQGYYASLSYMDRQVGKVLDALTDLGLAESTIVVLWGDHGYHLGDHGMWTKHTNYEQANRIPIVFSGPGILSGVSTRAFAESVDIYPTLASLAGLPSPSVPQRIDGLDLSPVLTGSADAVRDHAYHAFPRPGGRLGRAIRTDRYRLVEWKCFEERESQAEYELYDYKSDPRETRNFAASQPDVVEELREILDRHPAARPPINEQSRSSSK